MTDEIFTRLMLTTIDRYDRSVRLSFALIAILVVVHLSTFGSYIDTQTDIDRTQAQIIGLKPAFDSAPERLRDVAGPLKQLKTQIADLVNDTFREMRRDFAFLNLDVARIWCHQPQSLEYVDPANCLSEAEANVTDVDCSDAPVSGFFSPSDPNRFQKSVFGCSQQGQVQIRIEVPEGKVFNSPLTMDLASKIAELPKRDEALVDLLEPLIEEHLVQPRLEKLRAEWSEKAPAKVQQAADAANRWLEGIPKDLPGLDRSLTEGFEAVSELLDKAATVEIVAPEGRWWLYFEGKREVGDSIISQLSLQKSEGGLLGALNIVLKELESVTERAKGALGQLTSTMESLRKQFDSQKKQLAKLLSPIEAIPLELGFFCRHFPLILLIAGVIFIVWPGERLRIVMLTRSMMREAGQDDSLWHWLQHRRERGLGPGVVVAANYFVGFAVTALAVFAAVRLSTLSGSGPEVWYELGIGTGLIALAMLWRFLAVDRDIRYF